MGFWEFLLWVIIAYFVYKLLTSGEVDKEKLKVVLLSVMRQAFNPPLDEIIAALNDNDVKKARAAAVKFRAELNDPNILDKKK